MYKLLDGSGYVVLSAVILLYNVSGKKGLKQYRVKMNSTDSFEIQKEDYDALIIILEKLYSLHTP